MWSPDTRPPHPASHTHTQRRPVTAPQPPAGQDLRSPAPLPQPPSGCSCGGRCPRCKAATATGTSGSTPAHAPTSQPGDATERAADTLADHALAHGPLGDEAPAASGAPLQAGLRRRLGSRLGADLAGVRLHHGPRAAQAARALGAQAFTWGQDIVMGAGWQPRSRGGQRLLAHEAAHTVQGARGQAAAGVAHRQFASSGGGFSSSDADAAAEREYGSGPPPPNAQTCGRPAHCPPGFCDPYRTVRLAEYYRASKGPWLMLGISAAVNSRVVPFWQEYLRGGGPARDISPGFAADFTGSPSTARTSTYVRRSLELAVAARMAHVPVGQSATLSLPAFMPLVASAIDAPYGPQQMNFNIPRDVAGNLAGGIGKDQKACPSGAQPSPFNDERVLRGSATVTRLDAARLRVTPDIQYTVRDTVDLCPGDCGTTLEQVATVPLSQFEATGIAGDVPFSVDFPAPAAANTPFEVSASLPSAPPPAPAPAPAPKP